MKKERRIYPLLLTVPAALLFLCAPGKTWAGSVLIDGAGGYYSVEVTSLAEARFRRVVKQKYDFSCGSAAVATLLTYHYDRKTGEQEVFRAMFEHGDKETIRKQGFSMLDMKRYLESIGYPSNGYRVPLAKLGEAQVPVITLINTNGYLHFVVIKGLKGDEVLVGDPALGTKVIEREKFKEMWNGIAFVLLTNDQAREQFFNNDEDWAVRARAPLGTALMREGLSTFSLHIPGPDFF